MYGIEEPDAQRCDTIKALQARAKADAANKLCETIEVLYDDIGWYVLCCGHTIARFGLDGGKSAQEWAQNLRIQIRDVVES
jgi:hypothetical protein